MLDHGRIASREVEVDGEVTIEISAGGVVVLELIWNSRFPHEAGFPGWTCVGRTAAAAAAAPAAESGRAEWDWDADEQRQLAQLEDALRDYRREHTARREMRVRYWERQARDASADAAAAWGRARLAAMR
ncbi:hypothetical protein [Conexibacter sp. CPCC 206217]|uniref:hypothetical protein n=1 Tax=Conexibacter sp. CPCC 206217 TaxID=3064574 RepID=UPI00272348CC|nr:hypothetical protein [Conexibacter sp. CPCC 206217]MDO8210643.1 hypothetical protein [Conexibacter sp. CPCC 206217]